MCIDHIFIKLIIKSSISLSLLPGKSLPKATAFTSFKYFYDYLLFLENTLNGYILNFQTRFIYRWRFNSFILPLFSSSMSLLPVKWLKRQFSIVAKSEGSGLKFQPYHHLHLCDFEQILKSVSQFPQLSRYLVELLWLLRKLMVESVSSSVCAGNLIPMQQCWEVGL